jgi:hypothetical protein
MSQFNQAQPSGQELNRAGATQYNALRPVLEVLIAVLVLQIQRS